MLIWDLTINAHTKSGENPLFTKVIMGNENLDILQADSSVKNWWNLPINNPKQVLHNINAHNKFGENPLIFTQSYHPKMKIRTNATVVWRGIKGSLECIIHFSLLALHMVVICTEFHIPSLIWITHWGISNKCSKDIFCVKWQNFPIKLLPFLSYEYIEFTRK